MIWNGSFFTTKPATAESFPWLKAVRGCSPTDKNFLAALAGWMLKEKRERGHNRLFVLGVNGSIGSGKTTFCRALARVLNRQLKRSEGQALTRSLDDYYFPKSERSKPEFLARGYDPQGISNRGPAGTHDTRRLGADIHAFETSTPKSRFSLPIFDKQRDDRSSRSFQFLGKVGIFILEGWFVGAETRVKWAKAPLGLKRSVAVALKDYRPIFKRLDALWVFETPPVSQITAQRMEQQKTLNRRSRRTGMSLRQIRRFIRYFYQEAWQPGVTSPRPPAQDISFLARIDRHHRFLSLRAGAQV